MSLLGGIQRALNCDGSVSLHLTLLFDLDVCTSSGSDCVNVSSGATDYTGNGMHRNLDLFALHDRGRLALLNGTLANDLFPTFFTFRRRYNAVG